MRLRALLPCLAALLAAICAADTARGSEVWVGVDGVRGNSEILRFDMSGNPLGSFGTAGVGVNCMTLVGNQVWVDNGSGGITRYDQSGNNLGTITGETFISTAVVGNQVWAYGQVGNVGSVFEYSFGGALLGQFATGRINGMAQVGNVVWASTNYNGVLVLDLNGNYLYGLLAAQTLGTVAAAGGDVWVQNVFQVQRYDTAGNLLGSLGNFPQPSDNFTVAGNESWIIVGSQTYAGYDFSGQMVAGPYLGDPGFGYFAGIVVVPEPATIMFLGLGLAGVGYVRKVGG